MSSTIITEKNKKELAELVACRLKGHKIVSGYWRDNKKYCVDCSFQQLLKTGLVNHITKV